MRDTTFSGRVLEIALSIPPGKVATYGMIARASGGGGQAARSITAILAKAYNNGDTAIPFHRIVYADGRVFTGTEYDAKRRKLYKQEGIVIGKDGKIQDFEKVLLLLK
ncbi:MAG: MGMT family protein [bacterium]